MRGSGDTIFTSRDSKTYPKPNQEAYSLTYFGGSPPDLPRFGPAENLVHPFRFNKETAGHARKIARLARNVNSTSCGLLREIETLPSKDGATCPESCTKTCAKTSIKKQLILTQRVSIRKNFYSELFWAVGFARARARLYGFKKRRSEARARAREPNPEKV